MISASDLERDKALCERATNGPWVWRYCLGSSGPILVCPNHGLLLVADAVRSGMNQATMRFAVRTRTDKGGVMRRANEFFQEPGCAVPDVQYPNNPDMRFVAESRRLLPDYIAEVERLRDENAKLREAIKT